MGIIRVKKESFNTFILIATSNIQKKIDLLT